MKFFRNLVFALFILGLFNSAYSFTDTVRCTITNFRIVSGPKLSWDIYVRRQSAPVFNMGNSSFYFSYRPGSMSNPVLSDINPKYTGGNPSYLPMTAVNIGAPKRIVGVNIFCIGIGEPISPAPGPTGLGEKVVTVTMDIDSIGVTAQFVWDQINSGVANPLNTNAEVRLDSGFNGVLPVQLANFTSSVNRNNVTLNWSTSSEINNSGFDIERRSNDASTTEWRKVGYVNGNGNSTETRHYSYNDISLTSGKYSYRLKQVDFNGNFEYFNLQNEVIIGVPQQYELAQNYPNPFNPTTKINFSIPADSRVSLSIYDISGRLITTLIDNELKSANYYTIEFNASNISSGAYFYSLKANNFSETKKMLVIK